MWYSCLIYFSNCSNLCLLLCLMWRWKLVITTSLLWFYPDHLHTTRDSLRQKEFCFLCTSLTHTILVEPKTALALSLSHFALLLQNHIDRTSAASIGINSTSVSLFLVTIWSWDSKYTFAYFTDYLTSRCK